MNAKQYEITESVAGFSEGDILDVTARFGDWHSYDLKLESNAGSAASKTVTVTSKTGFSEADILDETARFGDWHTYDLTFEPVGSSAGQSVADSIDSPGPIRLTMAQLRSIAQPVTTQA